MSKEIYLIELKSFHPEHKSTPIPYEHITENNELIMDGHSYHNRQAVQGHLIDETYDTEEKMANYDENHINVMGVLLGFYLHLESLRDFVTIYRTGTYRFDDAFGKMTAYNLRKNFIGNINEFWEFPFYQTGFDFERGKNAISVSLSKKNDREVKL